MIEPITEIDADQRGKVPTEMLCQLLTASFAPWLLVFGLFVLNNQSEHRMVFEKANPSSLPATLQQATRKLTRAIRDELWR